MKIHLRDPLWRRAGLRRHTGGAARRALVAFVAAALAPGALADAQTTTRATTAISVQQFEPLHAQNLNILNVHSSQVLPGLGWAVGVLFHYMEDPLVLTAAGDSSDVSARFVGGQLTADIVGAFAMFDVLELGVGLPVVLYQHGDELGFIGEGGSSITATTVGDLRLIPKGMILDPERFSGFGLALALPIYVPTGDRRSFNSDGKARVMPQLIVDWRHEVGFKIALNAGYLVRPERPLHNITSDDQVRLALGLEVPLGLDELTAKASVFTAIQTRPDRDPAANLKTADEDGWRSTPLEGDLALQYEPVDDLTILAGGGAGFTRAVGSPDWRLFLGVGYAPTFHDEDGDGIQDRDDACPEEPEDRDDFQDEDGCPDPDNDQDGVLDAEDGCPVEAEDRDGFQDQDGCPDPDNDQDGLTDAQDSCPDNAEDMDGFQDDDGCPDPDNDQDGLRDGDDACPDEAEDRDGYDDEDGCPDPDNDDDGVLDADDLCPTQPETVNGLDDEDGCPDKKDQKVKITKRKIVIMQKVFFATGKAVIKPVSFPLLLEVAQALVGNPQISSLRVEGHTDDVGSDARNKNLSQRRAESVRLFLTEHGVASERLEAVGYGEERPIADNKTRAGRGENRRVEFTIVEVNGEPVEGSKDIEVEARQPVD